MEQQLHLESQRFRPDKRVQYVFVGLLLLGIYWQTLLVWSMNVWEDPNYSHAVIIPFVSLYVVWQRLAQMREAPVRSFAPGFLIIVLALALFVAGHVGAEFFSKRVSLVILIYGIILFLNGRQLARILTLPIVTLFFAIPLPYVLYNSIAFPLKLIATRIAVWGLGLMGLPVFREGNIISLPHATLEVVDACSGIRSLMTLITLAFLLACFHHKSTWKRFLVLLLAAPISVLANAGRVGLTGILTSYDPAWGEGTLHDFSGWAVFVLSFAVLIGASKLLEKVGTDGK